MALPLLVTVLNYDASCSRTLLNWTIADIDDERIQVDAFYKMALFICDSGSQQHLAELKHCLEEAKVGKTYESLIRIGNTGWSRSIYLIYIVSVATSLQMLLSRLQRMYVCWCRSESVCNCLNFWTVFEVFCQVGDT